MNSKFVLAVVALVAFSVAEARVTAQRSAATHSSGGARGNITNVEDYPLINYDCSDKVDGDYPHPSKCDHFVACVAKTHAYEMPCAMDHERRLFYVPDSGPTTDTSRCDRPEVVDCVPETPTTEKPGDQCDPLECKQKGDCIDYQVCTEGSWKSHKCDENQWWNPSRGVDGECDFWDNLPKDVQDKYLHDPKCIPPCEWYQLDGEKCTGKYHFREPFDGRLPRKVQDYECASNGSEQLIWSKDSLNCHAVVAGC